MKRFKDFSIRGKFAVIFIITGLLITIIALAAAYFFLIAGLNRAEDYYLENGFHSIQTVMVNTQDTLLRIVRDYANWDEMYDYINNPDEKWLKENVADWIPKNFKINLILMFDNAGKMLYQYGDFRELSMGSDLSAHPLIKRAFESKETRGLYSTSKGIVYIASSQIMHTDESGPRNGTYIYGKLISKDMLEELKVITGVDISIISKKEGVDSAISDIYHKLVSEKSLPFSIYKPNYQSAFVYAVLRDITGKDVGMLELTRPRKTIALLREVFIKISAWTVLSVVLIVFIAVLVITGIILKPLDALDKTIEEIKKTKDTLRRVKIESADEIGILAGNFNTMMDTLTKLQDELMQSQQDLIKSEKMTTAAEMAMGTVHQINNPLSIAIGRLQMLRRMIGYKTPIPEGDLEKDLKIIEEQVRRAVDITNGLLHYSVPFTFRFQKCDLNELLKDTLELAKVQLQAENIDVAQNLKTNLPALEYGDAEQLRDVFMNIIINAAQAMSGGGKLEISTDYDEQEEMVWAKFKDSGYGIAPEDIGKIFTPFFSTKADRTGLGMAISYNVVKGHRGTIEVESQVGVGSTFIVKLPVGGGINKGGLK